MAIDYKSLYRFGGYTIDQKRHLARLLATAEAATTSAEISRKVVHKSLAGKFARDETERWQRYFEGIRAAIDAEDTAYDIDPHMHGWRNYQLERLVKSWGTTIIGDKTYSLPNQYSPSQDLTGAGGDWTDSLNPAILGYGTASGGLGGGTDTTVEDNASGIGSSNLLRAQKNFGASNAAGYTKATVRIFVKKLLSVIEPLFYFDSDITYGESYLVFDLVTGAINGVSSYTGTAGDDYAVTTSTYDLNYWEVLLEVNPGSDFSTSDLVMRIYPAGETDTDVQTLNIGNAELYLGYSIADVQGTDPVFNT